MSMRFGTCALVAFALTATSLLAATAPEIDPAKSASFSELSHMAKANTDYRVVYKPGVRSYVIMAPHGGNIEPGSTEIAEAIAHGTYGFYTFNGLKRDPFCYVPSTKFDEPELARVTKGYAMVIAIHVIPGTDRIVYVGGNSNQFANQLIQALTSRGYKAEKTPLNGSAWNRYNLVNRGTSGGVQIEISSALVDEMFRGLVSSESVRQDPSRRTPEFQKFTNAIQWVLGKSTEESTGFTVHSADDKKKR